MHCVRVRGRECQHTPVALRRLLQLPTLMQRNALLEFCLHSRGGAGTRTGYRSWRTPLHASTLQGVEPSPALEIAGVANIAASGKMIVLQRNAFGRDIGEGSYVADFKVPRANAVIGIS